MNLKSLTIMKDRKHCQKFVKPVYNHGIPIILNDFCESFACENFINFPLYIA